jgi:hypothetical protein
VRHPNGWGLNEVARQKFKQISDENGYSHLWDITAALSTEVQRITDAILQIPSTDRLGDAIRLAAILMKKHSEDEDCYYSLPLWEMAAPAGFTKPDLDEEEA